jgi:hypothetical protein
MRRRLIITAAASLAAMLAMAAGPNLAEACAGLIGSNGAVNLGRTTTLAGYHDGVEHYVTSFEFQGGGGEFGTLIPLPAVPTKVERGGAWTLQRLQLETQQIEAFAADGDLAIRGAAFSKAEVLQRTRIDALDITVLKGGGASVAAWAKDHGFRLSPDAPEVLDFYASRSPIFAAFVFDGEAAAARGQQLGDGTPVHITMPTDNPWVPLRILGLGKQPEDFIEADVYLLTDERPALLPRPSDEMFLAHSQPANDLLLDDLRADDGMSWVPRSGWLTKLEINSTAAALQFDLAVDTTGNNPSPVAAGLELPDLSADGGVSSSVLWWLALAALVALIAIAMRRPLLGAGSR